VHNVKLNPTCIFATLFIFIFFDSRLQLTIRHLQAYHTNRKVENSAEITKYHMAGMEDNKTVRTQVNIT